MTAHDFTDKEVVILTGGWSGEREVAFDPARTPEEAFREAEFNKCQLIDVAASGLLGQHTDSGFDARNNVDAEFPVLCRMFAEYAREDASD
jgi:hypothetical protein